MLDVPGDPERDFNGYELAERLDTNMGWANEFPNGLLILDSGTVFAFPLSLQAQSPLYTVGNARTGHAGCRASGTQIVPVTLLPNPAQPHSGICACQPSRGGSFRRKAVAVALSNIPETI